MVAYSKNKKIKSPPDLSALPDGEAGDKAGNAPNGAKDLTAVPPDGETSSAVSSFLMEIDAIKAE